MDRITPYCSRTLPPPLLLTRVSSGFIWHRSTLVSILQEKFAHLNLIYSIGGQISFDIMPKVTGLWLKRL